MCVLKANVYSEMVEWSVSMSVMSYLSLYTHLCLYVLSIIKGGE